MESETLGAEGGGEESRHPGELVHSTVGLYRAHCLFWGGHFFLLYSSHSTAVHHNHTARLLAASLALTDSFLNHNPAAQNDINLRFSLFSAFMR